MKNAEGKKVVELSDQDLFDELFNARHLALAVFRNDEGVPVDHIYRLFYKRLRELETEFARRGLKRTRKIL